MDFYLPLQTVFLVLHGINMYRCETIEGALRLLICFLTLQDSQFRLTCEREKSPREQSHSLWGSHLQVSLISESTVYLRKGRIAHRAEPFSMRKSLRNSKVSRKIVNCVTCPNQFIHVFVGWFHCNNCHNYCFIDSFQFEVDIEILVGQPVFEVAYRRKLVISQALAYFLPSYW